MTTPTYHFCGSGFRTWESLWSVYFETKISLILKITFEKGRSSCRSLPWTAFLSGKSMNALKCAHDPILRRPELGTCGLCGAGQSLVLWLPLYCVRFLWLAPPLKLDPTTPPHFSHLPKVCCFELSARKSGYKCTQRNLRDVSEMWLSLQNILKVTCIYFFPKQFLTLKCLWNFQLKILTPSSELSLMQNLLPACQIESIWMEYWI